MKYIIILSLMCFLLIFAGCSTGTDIATELTSELTTYYTGPVTLPEETSVTEVSTTGDETTESQEREYFTEDITYSDSGIPIENAYYSLYLPSSWNNRYISDISFDESGSMIMNFREKQNAEENGNGLLFSLILSSLSEGYDDPNAKILHKLYATDGAYELYFSLPSDKQYTDETAQNYNAMHADINSILNTISAAQGCIFE